MRSDRPEVAELLARTREIAAIARERAQQTEAARRVSDEMVARMAQADLFRVLQPKAYGGFEYGFDVFAQVEAALASGCGSTGWVYGLLASHQWLIACLSQAAQDEVWDERGALAAGTYAPVAQAEAVEGGYLVSGSGGFCCASATPARSGRRMARHNTIRYVLIIISLPVRPPVAAARLDQS